MTNTPSRPAGKILDVVGNLRAAWRLVRDPKVPIWVKGVPLATLAYVLWPVDVVADMIPGLGQLDDLAVLLLGLRLFVGLASSGLGRQAETPGPEAGVDDAIDTTYRVLEEPDRDTDTSL